MKTFIDACSIILLGKATILEDFAKWKELVIPRAVYNEVLRGKNKLLLDALLLEKLVKEKKILVNNNLKVDVVQKLMKDFGLGLGEAETIALTLELKEKAIVTDNKQGRKAAKINGLVLLGSIDVIIALYKAKRVNKEKSISSLKILKEKGWFQNYLIEEALQEVKNG